MKNRLIILFVFAFCFLAVRGQEQFVENQISELIKDKRLTVGVAVLTDRKEMILYNDEVQYPLLSVFKLHVGLAVLDKMSRQNISLVDTIFVEASRLHPRTYSPLRDKYPNENLLISLKDLLKYSIALSDNNACDILIDYVGGINYVRNYISQLGINHFNLSETENTMHLGAENVYFNWSYPSETVRLMSMVEEKNLLAPAYRDFLWETMMETTTGSNKLKGELPPEVVVGHKTGSSGRTPDGMKIADNDAGFVLLPDGRRYYIAVFIMNSYETDQTNAAVIARISRIVYDALRSS